MVTSWRLGTRAAACGLMLLPLLALPAAAADCGGATACACGDRVVVDYALPADLGPCPGHGLLPESGVTLDCQGFRIVGPGGAAATYGIHLVGVSDVTVRSCIVESFERGIRLRNTTGSLVADSTARANGSGGIGYGIDLADGAVGNVVSGNQVHDNADEGIHVGTGSRDNELIANVLWDNGLEQIYVLNATGTRLVDNVTSGTGSNSLYLKDSSGSHLEGNRFGDRPAVLTGDARDNVLLDNAFVAAGLQIRVYEASPNRIPTDNVVLGGSITDAVTCLRLRRSRANTIADVALAGCGTQVRAEGLPAEPSDNTLIGMTLDGTKMSVDADSTLRVGWWAALNVEEPSGAPIPGASVRAVDALGAVAFDRTTDAAGDLDPYPLVQYVQTGLMQSPRTPYTLETQRTGYLTDERSISPAANLALTIVLEPEVAPTTTSTVTTTSTSLPTTTSTSTSTTTTRPRKGKGGGKPKR